MAKIAGHILIGRPVAEVFDFVADTRNEPSFNPAMAAVELLTALPIRRGTRFRARMGRAGMQMLVELTEFDRPLRLGSRTTSSMMQTSGTLTFASDGDGTLMSWDWQVHPKGWIRMLGPLFEPLGNRMERRIWTSMKRYLENTAARSITRPAPQPGQGGARRTCWAKKARTRARNPPPRAHAPLASIVPGTERAGGVAVMSDAVASVRRARNRCLPHKPGPQWPAYSR